MNADTLDWSALGRLRAAFLAGAAGAQDYWRGESDLASYDQTFAQRIGWKWDFVLGELSRRGWSPPAGEVLDWGCGSGVAGRAFLDHFGVAAVTSLNLYDRSALAAGYARRQAHEKYPGLEVRLAQPDRPAVLLISHVLTELNPDQAQALADFAAGAQAVLWVEPGTYEASLTLIAIRERLRGRLHVVAPCPHGGQCGLLAPGHERHWCHHFASPPSHVFTDPAWGRFAALAGIDLRSLPLSYLVLDSRPRPSLPPGTTRVLGRPRVYKAHARLLGCAAEGVRECQLTRRAHPEEFRRLRKGVWEPLQRWSVEDHSITALAPLPPRE
ncbi:MAG TPA: class I SAM-dependent methyltransferase [Methylomirabilota bacterium]|nr:class I SAM-dependent methyltransferase [Methylomirabilota bacterium]